MRLADKAKPKQPQIYNAALRTPIPEGNKNTIVSQIIAQFEDRNRAEIKKWRSALNLAKDPQTPRLFMLQDLIENLMSDGHLMAQIDLRKAVTLSKDASILDKKTGKVIPEKTDLFRSEWFYEFVNMALDKPHKGHTLLELINPATMQFTLIPRRNVVPQKKLVLFEATGDKGIDYSKGFEKTLIEIGKPAELGITADLCGLLIWKRNAQQSWAEFAEKYGHPLITATSISKNESDLAHLERVLKSLGEAARAVLPEGSNLDIKPFTGSDSYLVYDKQIERINGEIAKPLTGGTMVTDNGSSRSQSEVHERNLQKIAWQDQVMIEFLANGKLMPIMQMWGWDINPETDIFKYDNAFELSLKDHWDIVRGASEIYEIDQEWVSQTFNVPIIGKKAVVAPPVNEPKPTGSISANFR